MTGVAGEPLLVLEDINLRFGGLHALQNVSLEIRRGETLGIIGPNGAGKSSLLNVMNGIYTPTSGTIRHKGELIPKMRPEFAAKRGVGRTFQNLALFPRMSVLDNVMVGRATKMRVNFLVQALGLPAARREEDANRAHVETILALLGLESERRTPVGRLPYGIQKLVELARALACEPELLLLDEPMAGMNLEEKEDMSRYVMDAKSRLGVTVALIEHDMGVVMDISDRVAVLDYGVKIADGAPEAVRANTRVIAAYLGSAVEEAE